MLACHGCGAAVLQTGCTQLAAYHQAMLDEASAARVAMEATARQRAALTALRQWLTRYKAIARVALRERPELQYALHLAPLGRPGRKSATQHVEEGG